MNKIEIALVLCPCWAHLCPPLGMTYLTAALKKNGFSVKCFDLNIESYHFLKSGNIDYWDYANYYYWLNVDLFRNIIPLVKKYLEGKVKEILESNPDVIGFSVFDTGALASLYMAQEIKKIAPNKIIVFGGPGCNKEMEGYGFLNSGFVDAVIAGEGEEAFIELLERYKEKNTLESIEGSIIKKNGNIIDAEVRKEIKDLNSLAFPDFSMLDIKQYTMRALPVLTSRGCVARCSFCSEWGKFRFRKAENIIEELKQGIKNYNMKEFLFNDSLINGNVKELERLSDLIIENKMDIIWGGYARIDLRLNLGLLKKMKKAGCKYLSYGIESGSQKVLNDMNKRILLKDAANNLRDTKRAGIEGHINWIVGFPTESTLDFIKSLWFIYSNRKYIFVVNPGHGCGIIPSCDLNKNRKRYRISNQPFLNNWRTVDFTNTIIHRRIRLKILLNLLDISRIRHS